MILGAAYRYEYTIKDHLGNARISFADLNGNNVVDVPSDILQENHYYPFGMNMNYGWMNDAGLLDSRYQYNGKELNGGFGLSLSDYGARWYDASLGRWHCVDLIRKIQESPYMAFNNVPIRVLDPMGTDTSFSDEATKMEFNLTYQKVDKKISKLDKSIQKKWDKWSKDGFSIDSEALEGISSQTIERSELSEIKQSFDEIIGSTTMFKISGINDGRTSGGGTEFNHIEGRVDISYGIGNDHTLVHEVRHGAGYLRGEWGSEHDPSSTSKGKGKPLAYDYQDEYEGYKAGINYLKSIYGGKEVHRAYPDLGKEGIKGLVKSIYKNDKAIIKDFNQNCIENEK